MCGRVFTSVCLFSHAHKNTVMEVKWNLNGNWLLTASRDHLCKLFDIRNLKEELQVFRGHKKEATGESRSPTLLLSSWKQPGKHPGTLNAQIVLTQRIDKSCSGERK